MKAVLGTQAFKQNGNRVVLPSSKPLSLKAGPKLGWQFPINPRHLGFGWSDVATYSIFLEELIAMRMIVILWVILFAITGCGDEKSRW